MSDLPIYRRFGASDEEYEQALVLRDGVPSDLREPFVGWLHDQLTVAGMMGFYLSQEMSDKIGMLTGIALGARNESMVLGENLVRWLRNANADSLLSLVDATLYLGPEDAAVDKMIETLRLGRSMYAVGPRNGSLGLVNRIAEGEQTIVDRLAVEAGSAGALLQRSYSAAYAFQPNAGEAYKFAVKAVETAAHPVVEPKNTGATLGTMLKVLRDAPLKWTLPLDERADHVRGNEELLIGMMQSIWDGQEDRHRDGVVEIDEARAAFHAAVAVVGWFHDGLVRHGAQ